MKVSFLQLIKNKQNDNKIYAKTSKDTENVIQRVQLAHQPAAVSKLNSLNNIGESPAKMKRWITSVK